MSSQGSSFVCEGCDISRLVRNSSRNFCTHASSLESGMGCWDLFGYFAAGLRSSVSASTHFVLFFRNAVYNLSLPTLAVQQASPDEDRNPRLKDVSSIKRHAEEQMMDLGGWARPKRPIAGNGWEPTGGHRPSRAEQSRTVHERQ